MDRRLLGGEGAKDPAARSDLDFKYQWQLGRFLAGQIADRLGRSERGRDCGWVGRCSFKNRKRTLSVTS